MINAGKVRALAVTGAERSDVLPKVPDYVRGWFSGSGRPNLEWRIRSSAETRPQSSRSLRPRCKPPSDDSNVQKKLKAMGVNPGGSSGDAFRRSINADITKYVGIVKAANLTFE